ncbi:hypothetical protein J7K25_07590 [bacterium]|nr:hypothetical protein [bacterium]
MEEKNIFEVEGQDVEVLNGEVEEKEVKEEEAIAKQTGRVTITSLEKLKTYAETIDERIGYLKKMQEALLKLAYPGDWVIFESTDAEGNVVAKGELTWKGAVRILRNLEVKVKDVKAYKETQSDGHYTWWHEGWIEFAGSVYPVKAKASSKQKFWSVAHGKPVPVEDISEADVKIASYHEFIKAIPKIVLGFAGIPVEELKRLGVALIYARKVEFKSKQEKEGKVEVKYWVVNGERVPFVKGDCLRCKKKNTWVMKGNNICYNCHKEIEKKEKEEEKKK